ncbi:amidohydrolase family protein [Psychrobacillus sp. NPDC096426]|uniref:amidohydrolase family protein n=1 Tax=Psychrobacillus sp. NPDC096426 TaxID=3364491 RepID=UPI00381927B5
MRNFVIKNGTIIDVENGGSYVGSIEVERNMVKRIFTRDDVLPEGLATVDAEGKYIIPGLIDMHCHINEGYAAHFVASGVTTVRNAAGNVMLLKNLIEKPDHAPTPRIYASDRMIDGTPGLWGPTSYGNFVTDDPEEARKEVRRQVEAGANFIKLYGWIKREVMEAVTDEAKKYKLEVACDLLNSKELTAIDAVELGVNWIEHASGFAQEIYKDWNPFVDQEKWSHINWNEPDQEKIKELCVKMLESNVKLCPTIVVFDQPMKYPALWSPSNPVMQSIESRNYLMQEWKKNTEYLEAITLRTTIVNNLTKAVAKTYFDMGGTVVAGTDSPGLLYTYPGMALHRELEIFVEIGFTEIEALKAATVNAAKSINLDDIGVIKEGYFADFIILNDNPLDNIKNTKDIHTIVKGGKAYTQEDILSHIPSEEEVEKSIAEFMKEWDALGVD